MAFPGKKGQKQCSSSSASVSTTVKERKVSTQGEFRVQTSNYTSYLEIGKMTLLSPDCMIITDNKAVLMVDIGMNSVIGRLQLDSNPNGHTLVSSTDLAVTLPFVHKIKFISTLSGKLRETKTLKVDGNCYDISCYQEKLVVCYLHPAKLQILDTNGTVLNTFRGEHAYFFPVSVTCNSSSIYVSDSEKKTVTRLNWQGEVIGSYDDLSNPSGLTLSSDGTIFVCDKGRNEIKEIAGDCSTGRIVLQNLQSPTAVCWCPEHKAMFFNTNSGLAGTDLIKIVICDED